MVTVVLAGIRAELTKIVTLRSTWIVTAAVLALHLLICMANLRQNTEAVATITPDGLIELFAGQPRPAYQAIVDFLVSSSFQMGLFLSVLAAVLAGQEFRAHQLGQSVLAVPGRGVLVTTKTVAVAAYLLTVSLVIAAISTAFMYAAVRGWDPAVVTSGGALRGQGRFLIFAVLSALVGYALTLLSRSTLIGIVASVALIAVTMTQALAGSAPALDALFPLSAGRNLLLNPADSRLTAGPVHALVVLVSWPSLTTAIAGLLLSRRDAR
ncbi:ABC transporter permease [Plantactinospora sp. S1510]|uniref:ABC transporter permease n=1 Tax=Plantactinospora alkalitolerans TaxID=2789879 RepID=A0ABS0H4A1_9ACTN|nr:ABC transporter permease [Plantactinospora alkalitolerans]MBF9133043.1 ABC transporter permease [Plantactinospora alkalitolerans]